MNAALVRWANLEDAKGVATVHVEAWRVAYRGLVDASVLERLRIDERTNGWARWISASLAGQPTDEGAASPHRLLVAVVDERIAGWAGFGEARDPGVGYLAELGGLYVHPDFWSRGIGHALIVRAESELARTGAPGAYLWVLDGNARAIHFYEQHGWAADGAVKVGEAGGARGLRELRYVRDLDRQDDGRAAKPLNG